MIMVLGERIFENYTAKNRMLLGFHISWNGESVLNNIVNVVWKLDSYWVFKTG